MKERKKSVNKGLVSVIIPVYNAEAYLERCLQSIFDQTYKNFEVICINDGSTDNSLIILQSYYERYPQKMKIESIPNGGQANARNIGMDMAQGEFICFVDSDDSMNVVMLEKMYEKMQENECDFLFCNMDRIIEGKMNLLERRFKYDTELNFAGVTTIYEHPEIICYIIVAPFAKLIRKTFLDRNNLRFIKGYIYEDLVFTQSILAANPRICMLKDKLYNYLVRNNSTMTSKNSKVTDMFVAYENLYNEYDKRGLTIDFKQELDYLCLYHVMIGTSYRMWNSGKCGMKSSILKAKSYCRLYHCDKSCKYMKRKGILTRVYIAIFYK